MKKLIYLFTILVIIFFLSTSLVMAFSWRDVFTRETERMGSNQEEDAGRGDAGRGETEEEIEEENEDLTVSLYSYSCNIGGAVNYGFEMYPSEVQDEDDYKICVDGN